MVQVRPDAYPLYPEPSFPQSVPIPVLGVEPELAVCFDTAWLPYVLGALQQLLQPTTWQGDDDDILAIQAEVATLIAAVANPTCATTGEIPTPFWDDVTDTEDEYPTETQPWYGYVTDADLPPDELTFIESAGIWAFTGLLALTGTPAAAILFHTTAPSFVLAMRGDSFAEVIRVVVDAQDAVEVETSGDPDELIQLPIFPDPDLSAHDVLIILRELL